MNLLDYFTAESAVASNIDSTLLRRQRKVRDTIAVLPVFENTIQRLNKAKRRALL